MWLWLCCLHREKREGRGPGGEAGRTLACMRVAHLIIKLIKASIWQCHSCPVKRRRKEEKQIQMLRSPRTSCQGLLFIEHCMCLARTATGNVEGGGLLSKKKKSFYKQMTRRRCILMSKNGSRKINTHQKEQQRNKKGSRERKGELETGWHQKRLSSRSKLQ